MDFSDEEFETFTFLLMKGIAFPEEDMNDNILSPVMSADVCGHLGILTNKMLISRYSLRYQVAGSSSNGQGNRRKKIWCSSTVKSTVPNGKRELCLISP
ncbi:hypothetical protein NPIL_211331 [Nephila pilipes]|uniref:Uncharacterized protein n=1 Tax=Nephila pilipes TaxID=299642 RepID=A0A8X6PM27_NEPPI|nr:hypothetical protein NPIL_211331 [Nephila pilipes]